jgi:hypothetical protein
VQPPSLPTSSPALQVSPSLNRWRLTEIDSSWSPKGHSCIWIQSWHCSFYRLYTTTCTQTAVPSSIVHCPVNPLCSDYLSLPLPNPGQLLMFLLSLWICLQIAYRFSRLHTAWNHTVCSVLHWLLLLSNIHWRFLHVFLYFDRSFILVLNNIPLSVCTTAYFSFLLLKGFLVASKFRQLWIKPSIKSVYRFCVETSFQFVWINTKEYDCWTIW